MGLCLFCGKEDRLISGAIAACSGCIKERFDLVRPHIEAVHKASRRDSGLPEEAPKAENGIPCRLCMRECLIPEGERGYCGLRVAERGRVRGGRPHEGNLSFYHDPLPTNCVADFVCPGGTGAGHPQYAHRRGPERDFENLAVFYHACSFNCLFCQNHQFRRLTHSSERVPASTLAGAVDAETSCICYFGGDPTPQILHAVKCSNIARRRREGGLLRICWETNGTAKEPFLEKMLELSLESGGCIKFDLKAWDDRIHQALCGASNRHILANVERAAARTADRPTPPLLVASTLLVPGYVDEEEVKGIASFLARLNPEIPYNLLAFHPGFLMGDLPFTSSEHAFRCRQASLDAGLRQVHIGNMHLLGVSIVQ